MKMTEESKGRLIGNANFTSISTAKRKKERKSTAPDDLGTDSIPFKQWPPPHHFLARFFDAPVSVNSGRGSAEHEEIEDDGLVYTRKGLLRPKAGDLPRGVNTGLQNTQCKMQKQGQSF